MSENPGHSAVAVWTPKNFFPLLICPQGSQGCQKITFFLQMIMFSFCAKIAPNTPPNSEIVCVQNVGAKVEMVLYLKK